MRSPFPKRVALGNASCNVGGMHRKKPSRILGLSSLLLVLASLLLVSCGKKEVETTFILKKTNGEIHPVAACAVYILNQSDVEKIFELRQTFKNELTTLFDEETRGELETKGFEGRWSIDEIDKMDQLITSISTKTGVSVEELQGKQRGVVFANSMMASALARLGRDEENESLGDIRSGRKALAQATDKVIELLNASDSQVKTDASGKAKVKVNRGEFLFVSEWVGDFVISWLLPSNKLGDSIFSQEDAIFAGEASKPAAYFFTPVGLINDPSQLLLSDEAYAVVKGPANPWLKVKFRNE